MGWADPAQPAGPDSAQWCWADFGPKWIGPISTQNGLGRSRPKKLIFSSGPDPAQKAGLGQDQPGPSTRLAGPEQVWPSTRNQRGGLFPPILLHAERMFCMQKEMQVTEIIWGGRKVYLARRRRWRRWYCCCWRRCCGGGQWLTNSGSGSAVSTERRCFFFPVFPSVSSFPFLYFGSSPFWFVPSSLWFVFSSVLFFFFFLSLLSVLSLSGLFFFLCFFRFLLPSLRPPSPNVLGFYL